MTTNDLRNFDMVRDAAERAFCESHAATRAQIAAGTVKRVHEFHYEEVVVLVEDETYPAFSYQRTGRDSLDIFVPRDAFIDGEEWPVCDTFWRAGAAAAHAFDEEMAVFPVEGPRDSDCNGVYLRDDNRLVWGVVPARPAR